MTRVLGVDVEPDAVVVRTRVAPAVFGWGALVALRYESDGDAIGLHVRVDPDGMWPCTWARVGLRIHLPFTPCVRWTGLGPDQAYPDTGLGQRLGTWEATLEQLRTDYVRPQESGSRAQVTELEMTDAAGSGLRITGDGFAFTANPWTAAELAAAAHPTDLPTPRDGCWLTIDFAQHGVGTGACGPGVLPPYRLEPRSVEGRLALRLLP
jgi:beta-galactosidase